MRRVRVLFVVIGVFVLSQKCDSLCQISGELALCDGRSLVRVPMLPSYVTRVSLSNNYIGEVNETSFAGQEQLESIDLGTQKTEKLLVRNNAFRGLTNLTFLHLGDIQALILEPSAFVGLTNLKNLVLLYSGLDESILEGDYLRPLQSLETLNLFGNKIRRIRPALFFQNMTKLKEINLKLNTISSICEGDLLGFQGKHFHLLELSSIYLRDMNEYGTDWKKCGNPFANISVTVLALSGNGFSVEKTQLFFKATEGTRIDYLILSSNTMGRSIGYFNLKDPDKRTFEGLGKSSLKILDISKNSIFSLQFSVFSALKEAEVIMLAHNKINKIEKGAFLGLISLRGLDLSNNLLGEIYPYTFENLPNVVHINLSYNHIGVIVYKSFDGLYNLTTLDLTGNSITVLHTFAKIPNLKQLLLGDNDIQSVYGLPVFAKTSTVVELGNNKLRDLKALYEILANLPYVQTILFGSNLISVCFPSHSIPPQNSLMVLDLQKNAMQSIWASEVCLDVFDNLSNLHSISLMGNALRSPLPKGIFKGLVSLKSMDLSFNMLTYLPKDTFPKNLKSLDLSHNSLSSPDPDAFLSVVLINLSDNPFFCDCSLKKFLPWLNKTNTTFASPKESLRCEFPKQLLGVSLVDCSADVCEEDDENLMAELRIVLLVTSSTVLVLTTVGGIAFAHLRGTCFNVYKRALARVLEGPRNDPAQDRFKYDAYLCFSHTDFRWVNRALLKRLDSQFSENNLLRLCFEARDFMPGEDHVSNIRDAIWHSRKTVCVVSREFLKDGWCLEAFSLAQSRMIDELRDVLVMVVVGRIPHYQLMKYQLIRAFVQKREYLQWPEDSQDLEWFYDRLTLKILKQGRVEKQSDIKLQNIPKS
ncbi:hypothetical protein ANANG_G00137420 [Anguilla anguilla]|uniref:Toll-like receptor 5 n=1 Tax=Anguilla anguilla TaxID=7936 RepID=A0A9D3RW30_ANGAN|nr:hypothetical protein ANANG_G00137420 [Anguilla anguilla]